MLEQIIYEYIEVTKVTTDARTQQQEDYQKLYKEQALQKQIDYLQKELDEMHPEKVSDLRKFELRIEEAGMNETAKKEATKILNRLKNEGTNGQEAGMLYDYLDFVTGLSWKKEEQKEIDLDEAEKILSEDHFGLKKVKERMIQQIAVMNLKKQQSGSILLFVGAPGTGKTSIGKSIAKALGRKYVRVSLGGVRDEADIRGHRRTYLGAMPGRIMDGIQKSGVSNPVMVLDEVDKLSASYNGDPAAALLEVLDPEQNNTFHDNYIDLDFDLSNVLFIATANTLSTISRPLLDRMELLELSGYITEEKIEIAKRHLVPHQLEEHGLKKTQAKFSNRLLEKIIEQYTRESGVRALEKQLAAAMRKIAKKVVAEEPYNVSIKESELKEYLGPAPFSRDMYQGNKYVGVVTGLAWTRVGGEILFIESSLHKGKDSRPTLTGNLGDVMKESAIIALNYTRAHAAELDIDPELFASNELHIHVPEGAIPKDGPSAGITMVTSIVSAFTQRLVRERIAMTGEITLRGKVLPVGGVKEKILAAKRAGITDIVLSSENKKDIDEINEIYTKGITFHYVDDIRQVLDFALLPKGKKQK